MVALISAFSPAGGAPPPDAGFVARCVTEGTAPARPWGRQTNRTWPDPGLAIDPVRRLRRLDPGVLPAPARTSADSWHWRPSPAFREYPAVRLSTWSTRREKIRPLNRPLHCVQPALVWNNGTLSLGCHNGSVFDRHRALYRIGRAAEIRSCGSRRGINRTDLALRARAHQPGLAWAGTPGPGRGSYRLTADVRQSTPRRRSFAPTGGAVGECGPGAAQPTTR